MLNRIYSRLRGPENSLRTMGMRSHFAAQAVRIGNDSLHLLESVLRSLRIVTLGKHPAGSTDFDQVRSIFYDLTDLVLHAFYSIGYTASNIVILIRKKIVIAVSAGYAQRGTAYDH